MGGYDFTAGKEAAAKAGLSWPADVEAQLNREFFGLGLEQFQVDRLLTLYVHYFDWGFRTVATLPFWKRVGLALFILRGKR